MILYIYGKCSTCKNAVQFLNQHKIQFEVREITQETPSISELQKMLGFMDGNIKKLLNTSGQLYREMKLSYDNGGNFKFIAQKWHAHQTPFSTGH